MSKHRASYANLATVDLECVSGGGLLDLGVRAVEAGLRPFNGSGGMAGMFAPQWNYSEMMQREMDRDDADQARQFGVTDDINRSQGYPGAFGEEPTGNGPGNNYGASAPSSPEETPQGSPDYGSDSEPAPSNDDGGGYGSE